MEHIDSNMKACLATIAASQWLNIRLQFIGVIIVTCVALIALVKKQFDYVDPGKVKFYCIQNRLYQYIKTNITNIVLFTTVLFYYSNYIVCTMYAHTKITFFLYK